MNSLPTKETLPPSNGHTPTLESLRERIIECLDDSTRTKIQSIFDSGKILQDCLDEWERSNDFLYTEEEYTNRLAYTDLQNYDRLPPKIKKGLFQFVSCFPRSEGKKITQLFQEQYATDLLLELDHHPFPAPHTVLIEEAILKKRHTSLLPKDTTSLHILHSGINCQSLAEIKIMSKKAPQVRFLSFDSSLGQIEKKKLIALLEGFNAPVVTINGGNFEQMKKDYLKDLFASLEGVRSLNLFFSDLSTLTASSLRDMFGSLPNLRVCNLGSTQIHRCSGEQLEAITLCFPQLRSLMLKGTFFATMKEEDLGILRRGLKQIRALDISNCGIYDGANDVTDLLTSEMPHLRSLNLEYSLGKYLDEQKIFQRLLALGQLRYINGTGVNWTRFCDASLSALFNLPHRPIIKTSAGEIEKLKIRLPQCESQLTCCF